MNEQRWVIPKVDHGEISRIRTDFGLTRPTAMVLAHRRIGLSAIETFLYPRLQHLSDPFLLPGTREAAARLWQAIKKQEHILIHGDYDTDGITSASLLAWLLTENGAVVECFVPHRIDDGYGLTVASIDKAVSERHRLLVTVDCGINSCDAVRKANARGLDVIVTDHHQAGATLPEAVAVIDPRLHDHLEDLHCLAGVGVTFKLCHAFVKYGLENNFGGMDVDLKDGMDLVALGTVADIVPLLGENRCIVKHGMKVLSAQRRPGIRALCEMAGLHEQVQPSDITFRLAPRLNAAGRMGDASDAMRLLQSTSIVEAYPLASNLDLCNRRRQTTEEETLNSALAQIAGMDMDKLHATFVFGRNWHLGVIGIVASRLVQLFNRPTVVLSINDDGQIHGSGRSVDGVNLVDTLATCRDFLDRYGGHPMASGMALCESNLAGFQVAFESAVGQARAGMSIGEPRPINLDGDVGIGEFDEQFFSELELLEPFGHKHSAPRFQIRNVNGDRVTLAGKKNTRGRLVDSEGKKISFIAFGRIPDEMPPLPWDVVGMPHLNRYRGTTYSQVQIADVRTATLA